MLACSTDPTVEIEWDMTKKMSQSTTKSPFFFKVVYFKNIMSTTMYNAGVGHKMFKFGILFSAIHSVHLLKAGKKNYLLCRSQ